MESMTVRFPNNEQIEIKYGKPIVVIGANGSGKTRFSVEIENKNDPACTSNRLERSHIHRLSAQKSLTLETSIPILDLESSMRNLFLGNPEQYASKNGYRFHGNPVTATLDDYRQVLSLLFATEQKELQKEHNTAKKCSADGTIPPAPIETVVDRATIIWNTLLPHRTIDLSGNGVHVNYRDELYHGKEMSDGERVILYMIAQALVVKPKSLFIIDEPELHIHKAIVNELWTLLENERPDCIFMYLTHDIDFAMSRNDAQYLWIKGFDGNRFDYVFLDIEGYPDLPAELLVEILGTRQKILFVEGTRSSYDYKLYQEIYREKGYHVIPCGGCQDVIRIVKAKRTYEQLGTIEVYGIVDRDYRVEREIEALKADGIFTLEVAEVENLFVIPEILEIMEEQLGCDAGTAEQAKQFILDLYNCRKEKQIAEALSKEITHQLSLFDMGTKAYSDEEIRSFIDAKYTVENIRLWRAEKEAVFNAASTLPEVLKVFNCKDISKKIGSRYQLSDRDFPKRVLNVLSNNKKVRLAALEAFTNYVPALP